MIVYSARIEGVSRIGVVVDDDIPTRICGDEVGNSVLREGGLHCSVTAFDLLDYGFDSIDDADDSCDLLLVMPYAH